MKSGFFKLNVQDFIKGLVMAVLAAIVAIIKTTVESGSLHFDWPTIGKYALVAATTYLTKNLFSNSKGDFATKEPE